MYTIKDMEQAEDTFERAIQFLRLDENKSPHAIATYKDKAKRELEFLRDEFPESYVHNYDYSDVGL